MPPAAAGAVHQVVDVLWPWTDQRGRQTQVHVRAWRSSDRCIVWLGAPGEGDRLPVGERGGDLACELAGQWLPDLEITQMVWVVVSPPELRTAPAGTVRLREALISQTSQGPQLSTTRDLSHAEVVELMGGLENVDGYDMEHYTAAVVQRWLSTGQVTVVEHDELGARPVVEALQCCRSAAAGDLLEAEVVELARRVLQQRLTTLLRDRPTGGRVEESPGHGVLLPVTPTRRETYQPPADLVEADEPGLSMSAGAAVRDQRRLQTAAADVAVSHPQLAQALQTAVVAHRRLATGADAVDAPGRWWLAPEHTPRTVSIGSSTTGRAWLDDCTWAQAAGDVPATARQWLADEAAESSWGRDAGGNLVARLGTGEVVVWWPTSTPLPASSDSRVVIEPGNGDRAAFVCSPLEAPALLPRPDAVSTWSYGGRGSGTLALVVAISTWLSRQGWIVDEPLLEGLVRSAPVTKQLEIVVRDVAVRCPNRASDRAS